MSIRREPTYLSREVWTACWLIGQSESDQTRIITADEVADRILKQAILENHPQLVEYHTEIAKLKKKTIEELRNKK